MSKRTTWPSPEGQPAPACPSPADRASMTSAPQAQVQVSVIPNAGHALNLHRNAPDTFATVPTWTRFEPAG